MSSDQSIVKVTVYRKGKPVNEYRQTCDEYVTRSPVDRRAWQISKRHWLVKEAHYWANTSGGSVEISIQPPGKVAVCLKKTEYW